MKLLLSLVLVTGALGSLQPALAQVPADPPAEWRLAGAGSTTPTGPGLVKEVVGILVSDSKGMQIRFEASGRPLFVVPYERITAMHHEDGEYPRRFLSYEAGAQTSPGSAPDASGGGASFVPSTHLFALPTAKSLIWNDPVNPACS